MIKFITLLVSPLSFIKSSSNTVLTIHSTERFFLRMTEMDEMESDENNKQYTETCDVGQEAHEEGAVDNDLEEGECSSEEEPPTQIEEKKEEKDHSRKKSHRRNRSRDRHKRSKRDRERERKELDADEKKV